MMCDNVVDKKYKNVILTYSKKLQNGFEYKKNSQLFLNKFPCKSSTNAFKSFICRQETPTATGLVIARQNCNCWQQ